jgi:hypothetical protein
MSNEYEQDAALLELNQKFAHVHIDPNEATLNISDDLVK